MNTFMSLPPGPTESWPRQLWSYVYGTTTLLDACAERFGDVFTLRLGAAGTLVLVHKPEHVREVFAADPDVLRAGVSNAIAKPIVGSQSIFVADGPSHFRKRRLLLPPFHGERMRTYAPLMAEVAQRVVGAWKVGERRSIHSVMQSITLEVILRAVFGLHEAAEIAPLGRALRELFAPLPAIFSYLPQVQVTFPGSPFWFWLRRRTRVVRMLDRLISERRQDPKLGERSDILSLLLLARDQSGSGLSDEEVHDELITAVVAGHETSAIVLAWAFERILAHPEVERRLREELAHVQPAAVEKLPFLDAVVNEVLRQRPLFPLVARAVTSPFQIGDHVLPVGVFVCPCAYLTHKRRDVFAEPERFDPDRWLGVKPDAGSFFPFGGGVRRCVGMAFATLEIKIVLASILGRFQLRLDGGPSRVVRRSLMLFPEGGTKVVVAGIEAR
jgi:cytochrome P450